MVRPRKPKGESGKKPGLSKIALGRKASYIKDPQRIEQVGEIHVLEAKVEAGTATEREKLLFTVQSYELKHMEYKDLLEKEARGRLSLFQKEDMVWLSGKLADGAEEYHKALQKLRDMGEDI